MKKICLTFLTLLSAYHFSLAQWTASGTNIYNSNSGYVGIQNEKLKRLEDRLEHLETTEK